MAEEFIAIPSDAVEEWRTVEMIKSVNASGRNNREADDMARKRAADARTQEEKNRKDESDAAFRVLMLVIAWVAACATMVLLAHTGAVAGWLMNLGTVAVTGWTWYEIGAARK